MRSIKNLLNNDLVNLSGKFILPVGLLGTFLGTGCSSSPQKNQKPNIVFILSDDQGYADISFNPQHPKEVNTPNMDALARGGIFFTQAYISGNVSSPSRAGIMTGRYQQRCGIYTSGEGGSGLPLNQTIFPQYLKNAGYVCGAFGKWHLGLTQEYNPYSRGFDYFYGFLGRGAHDYFALSSPESPIYRNLDVIQDKGYLTDRLTDEAVSFIKNNKSKPFFVYLAYNAVHWPREAPTTDIDKYHTGDAVRDTLMAMLLHLDNGIGKVVNTLKEEGLWNNTLLVFLTDNGGAPTMHANNSPLHGHKAQNYEGGIRTPFVISWPAKFKGNRTVNAPIISLDILPTVLEAAGIQSDSHLPFDGKSILPLLENKTNNIHDNLFWSEGGNSGEWAVRASDWKLVVHKDIFELYNLKNDPAETTNIAKENPDKVKEISDLYSNWIDGMMKPMKQDSKIWTSQANSGNKNNKNKERRKKPKNSEEDD
ncbi:MAG TPA: sulfatase-like hydrolase/transferase [Bacteroidales bacterium]|nr:sulfatase-like hydrolase/transferase [Bacteroidales bacterium]